MIRILLGIALVLAATSIAQAHSASRSSSLWQQQGSKLQMIYSIDPVQATLLVPFEARNISLENLLGGHLAASIKVTRTDTGAICPAGLPEVLPSHAQIVQIKIEFSCTDDIMKTGWTLENNAFFDLASTHIHIAQLGDIAQANEFIFTDSRRKHQMLTPQINGEKAGVSTGILANFIAYINLGFQHILGGMDHLVFVTALVFLAKNIRDVALLVTGFTLGHSLTLSLSVFGLIQPVELVIEAMIGFSIAFVALEILIPPGSSSWKFTSKTNAVILLLLAVFASFSFGQLPTIVWLGLGLFVLSYGLFVTTETSARRASILLTSFFGLVHGAGFASVLIETGLPADRQISALAGFNIGVEIGQLLVVASWLFVLGLAAKFTSPQMLNRSQISIAGAIMAAGIYWMFSRSFGF